MTDTDVALFIDTNSFLQMKDFNQIAWRTLFQKAETITLFVCSAVIAELDKHKVSTNQRRRNRARNALRQIEEAAAATDMTLPIRETEPRVEIAIWRGKPVWSDFPDLDATNPDDYLVAAAATDLQSFVLSHDTGPRIRARIAGVRAVCPLDEWLLPAEQTDDQRKITQLNRELEVAQNARPRLQIIMPPDDTITIKAPSVPCLGSAMANKLAQIVLQEFPPARIRTSSLPDHFAILSDPFNIPQSRADYYYDQYQSFKTSVQSYFTTLHEHVERHALAQLPPGSIVNVGNVSAKNLTLVLSVVGEIELLAGRRDAESVLGPIGLPTPPEPPRPNSILDTGRNFTTLQPQPRSPTQLYWMSRPTVAGSELASFECADFRPGREEDFGVLALAVGELPSIGTLCVSVSAEHHEAVVSERVVSFQRTPTHWLDPLVQKLLPEQVQAAFTAVDAKELELP